MGFLMVRLDKGALQLNLPVCLGISLRRHYDGRLRLTLPRPVDTFMALYPLSKLIYKVRHINDVPYKLSLSPSVMVSFILVITLIAVGVETKFPFRCLAWTNYISDKDKGVQAIFAESRADFVCPVNNIGHILARMPK